MKATTIKLEYDILSEIRAVKPQSQSLTAFVKEILRREVERRKMRDAAARYVDLMNEYSEEQKWLQEWESANLAKPPARRTPSSTR